MLVCLMAGDMKYYTQKNAKSELNSAEETRHEYEDGPDVVF